MFTPAYQQRGIVWGLKIEVLEREDLKSIRFLQPKGWPDIIREFDAYIRQDFCFPFKAVLESRIAGTGAIISYGDTGWLAHIIVERSLRRKGIGQAITRLLTGKLKDMGKKSILLLATEEGYPLYLKLGFVPVCQYIFLKRNILWKNKTQSERIVPFKGQFMKAVLELDQFVTGEDRSGLLGPVVDSSYLYLDPRKKVTGCYIPGAGEGPILALDEEAGIELMRFKYARNDIAVIPSSNLNGLRFLKENGFVITEKKGTRMEWGPGVRWNPGMIYSRIGGNYG